MEMETRGEIKIIDGKGWVKRESLEKTITQIGSNPANDIVLDISRGKGVAPRHAQIICWSDTEHGYRLVNLGDTDIQIGATDERTISPRAAIDLGDGEVFQIGDFTLVAQLGDVVVRRAPSSGEHIGLELLLPDTPLIPGRKLDGAIVLGNLGEEENVQFTIDLEGLPQECYRIEPAPTLFPSAEKRIRFHLYHRGDLPLAGRHQILIHAVAPNAYPGQEATVSRVIQVLPHYEHHLRLLSSDAVEVIGKKGRAASGREGPPARARARSPARARERSPAPPKEEPPAPPKEEPPALVKEKPLPRRRKPLAQIGTWWGRMFEPRAAVAPEMTLEDVFSAEARQAGARARKPSEISPVAARAPRLGPELVEQFHPEPVERPVSTGEESMQVLPGAQLGPQTAEDTPVQEEPAPEPEAEEALFALQEEAPGAEVTSAPLPEPAALVEMKTEPVTDAETEPVTDAEPIFSPSSETMTMPSPEIVPPQAVTMPPPEVMTTAPIAEQEIPAPQQPSEQDLAFEDLSPAQQDENWWGLEDEGSEPKGDGWFEEEDEGSEPKGDGWFAEEDAPSAPPPIEPAPVRPRKVRVLKARTPKEEEPVAASSPQGEGEWWGGAAESEKAKE